MKPHFLAPSWEGVPRRGGGGGSLLGVSGRDRKAQVRYEEKDGAGGA